MSSGSDRSCSALGGACKTNHVKYPGTNTAFGFSVTLNKQDGVRLEAELAEMDPEEGYPQKFEIWAQLCGEFIERAGSSRRRQKSAGGHTHLPAGAGAPGRDARRGTGEGGPVLAEQESDFFGPEYTLSVPEEPQALLAQLFRSQDGQDPPVVSFHSSGLSADLDAGQTRAFAMKLRRMADDVDRLAARLDRLMARHRTAEGAEARRDGGVKQG
ncbi:hypothetical protein ACFV6Z_29600 [Streptomyces sp. NPDC059818]|uniref:hypothetical protein n=1 Tax=Streptomyces sp. NPDC059818 TaxID=3346962 RepID=UPI003658EC86